MELNAIGKAEFREKLDKIMQINWCEIIEKITALFKFIQLSKNTLRINHYEF